MAGGKLNIGPGLVIAALAGAAILFARSKTKTILVDPNIVKRYINRLQLNIVGFRIKNNNLILIVRVNNPNPKEIVIQSLVGDVYVNSQKFGLIAYYNGHVPAMKESQLVLAIKLINVQWMSYMVNFLTGRLKGAQVEFVGNMSVNNQVLAVKESFNV